MSARADTAISTLTSSSSGWSRRGKITVKRAYSDWHRYTEFKRAFHQAAIELIDVPQSRYSGKNSADIRMVVDALDLSYQRDHIDTFVLVSGDSDFSPLVSKLREYGRYVIGMGVKQSSSDLLINNCDEFIFYEDLVRPSAENTRLAPKLNGLPRKKAEALGLVVETFEALQREGKEVIYGSVIKQTLVRSCPRSMRATSATRASPDSWKMPPKTSCCS